MIDGNLNNLIQEKIDSLLSRTPHTLDQQQIRLVQMICKEVINSVQEIDQRPKESDAEKELHEIKQVWKKLSKLLR
jgi:hypothetical protein